MDKNIAKISLACWSLFLISVLSTDRVAFAEQPSESDQFIDLFDGKSLDQWDGDPQFWRVEDGVIVGETSAKKNPKQNTFLIHRGGEFADFELRLSYQVEGFNSGVQYRSVERGKWSVSGYQCDFEARWHTSKQKPNAPPSDKFSGMFFDEQGRMFMGQRGEVVIVRSNPKKGKKPLVEKIGSVGDPAELETHIRRDGWNELIVIAKGNQFTHIINGHVMAIGIDEDTSRRRASGLFAFQLHKGLPMKIRLKDIRVRRLGESGPSSLDSSKSSPAKAPVLPVSTSRQRSNVEYEQYALLHAGDVARGKKLFDDQRTRCVICHKVSGEGGEVGKDLSAIGGKFGRPHLVESLLKPSQQIVEGYRTTHVITADGKVIAGIMKSENENQITLVDANAKKHTILRKEIDEQNVSPVSIMPEGLVQQLSLEEFTDLIAYLESLGTGNVRRGGGIKGAISLPDGFTVRVVANGLDGLTALDVLPDGRVLVCEQPGRVRVIDQGRLIDTPVVSLPVDSYWERGVIGVTHDPEFPKHPYLYVCWVAKKPYPHHRISRFTMKGNGVVKGSEKVLLVGDDQTKMGGNVPAGHQGGALHFGPDGKLYIAIGEQTSGLPSQRLDTFLGKILRINPDGSIPSDNPLRAKTKGKYQAIWAYGCRNPFTFAIRKSDGLMLINDVGGKHEEINVGRAGANYGWPVVEHGNLPQYKTAPFDGPIHWYPQSSLNGGDFSPQNSDSQGPMWPSLWQDRFFFADYQHGWIRTIDPKTPRKATTFVSGIRQPVDLQFAPDGSLYVLLRNAWVVDEKFTGGTGSVLKITPVQKGATQTTKKQTSEKQSSKKQSHRKLPHRKQPMPKRKSASQPLPAGKVVLTQDAIDESAGGVPAFKIETPSATYYLDKQGGGLSSLVDRDGKDWLGFHSQPGSGATGEYRGFPNAVFQQDGSFFHALCAQSNKMKTRVERVQEGYVAIVAQTGDGQWKGRYEFFATHCTFTITKMPPGKHYWIMYEGTPGGELNLDDWWMTSATPSPQPMTKRHEGDIPAPEWMAFGDKGAQRSIVLLQHQDDDHPDTFYQMKQSMTVFGFGRKRRDLYHSVPGLQFSIGLVETSSHDGISNFAEQMMKTVVEPLSINVWYGTKQRFGHNGNPQRWINVLGRISGHTRSASLTYSLNGGHQKELTVGPNHTRLANHGDFNVEIDRSDLIVGENQIVLFATDGTAEAKAIVSVNYMDSTAPQLPIRVEWGKAKHIQEVAQVTDGLWKLTSEGIRIAEPYYDRVIAIGDESWTDYDVTVPVTFHGFRQPGPRDGGRNVVHAAIAVRWPGHADDGKVTQPRTKWYPLGATAEFMIQDHPNRCRWRILGGGGKSAKAKVPRQIEFEKRYLMKHRVQSISESITEYRVKFWDADQPEPSHWDVTAKEENDIAHGGALILAHYADVTFGDVSVTSLQ